MQHISQIAEGGPHAFTSGRAGKTAVDALVICPGLGARTLGGVEDQDVYPVRGQVVMIRAPWIKSGRTASHLANGLWTYIIPRRSGDVRAQRSYSYLYVPCSHSCQVILGGTKADNDW